MIQENSNRAEVVVVGAGISGLACARSLVAMGKDVIVIDAQGRVGGRMWSETLSNGEVVERGGEFILNSFSSIRTLAEELGLTWVDHGFSWRKRKLAGQNSPTIDELHDAMVKVGSTLENHSKDDYSWSFGDALNETAIDPRIRDQIRMQYSAPVDQIGAVWMAREGFSGNEDFTRSGRIRGGNQRIAERMAEQLPNPVRLRTVCVGISQSQAGIAVLTASGETIQADFAVVATTSTLVRELRFSPELSPTKREAFHRAMMSISAKISIPLLELLPPENRQAYMQPCNAWTAASQLGDGGRELLEQRAFRRIHIRRQ
jgi:monoamine oxidase